MLVRPRSRPQNIANICESQADVSVKSPGMIEDPRSKQIHESHLMTAGTDLRWIDGEINEDFRLMGGQFTRRWRNE